MIIVTETSPRATADDFKQLDRLLVQRMIEGLNQASPKASFLAVCQRYLADRKEELKRAAAPASTTLTPKVPFPREPTPAVLPDGRSNPSYRVPFPKTDDASTMLQALQKPFAADSDTPER